MAANQSTPVTWRRVVGWETFYEVSDTGRVRSLERHIRGRDRVIQRFRSHELTYKRNDHGYPTVHLRDTAGGRSKMALVHRIVAMAFLPNPDAKPCVNHLDCDVTNPHVSNLEWCSQQENLAHAASLGRMPRDYWKGRRSPNARLTDATIREMRATYARGGISWEALGKQFGVSKRCAGRIVKGESYADVR